MRRSLLGLLLAGALMACAPSAPVTDADTAAEPATPLTLGVLGGSCAADRVDALRGAGVRAVEVEVEWARFEPAPDRVDRSYVDALRARLSRCADAGLGVILTPGLHHAPAWVVALPDGAYRDQHGGANPTGVANLVFSATVRDAAARYLDRFAAEFPLDGFAAIRIGTSEAGELGYPGRDFGTGTGAHDFWAFDHAALTGDGLPAGMAPNPLPGWVPGTRTDGGRPVTDAQVRAWFAWYADAAARTVVWGVDRLREHGYRGPVHLPLAGRGTLPADLDAAVAAALDGTGDRDGSLERGLSYPDQLPAIAAATRDGGPVVADTTSVDDASSVIARGLDPPQDVCRPDDVAQRGSAPVETWSATRWTVANARAAGLAVVGENPGHPDTPGTGGDAFSDDLAAQLVHAPRYARRCGLETLLWAFEDDLFGPDPEVSVDDLGRAAHP